MAVSNKLKEAVKHELLKGQPLLDIKLICSKLAEWLTNADFPCEAAASSWSECLRTFPATEQDKKLEEGRRIRIVFCLHTKESRYLITIMESLALNNRGVYSIIAYVDWKNKEWEHQRVLEQAYEGKFDDALRASQTVWAQHFTENDFTIALDNVARAILANELEPECTPDSIGQPIRLPNQSMIAFPDESED